MSEESVGLRVVPAEVFAASDRPVVKARTGADPCESCGTPVLSVTVHTRIGRQVDGTIAVDKPQRRSFHEVHGTTLGPEHTPQRCQEARR